MSKTTNVFISHIHADDAKLADLKGLLSKNGLNIRDGSINSDKPNNAKNSEYIKNGIIAPRINWAGTLVVLVTPDTKNSEWVNLEIEMAAKRDMPIIGVWANGDKDCEVPEKLMDLGDAMLAWNGEKIVDAILNGTNSQENPNGTVRQEVFIPRACCG